MALPPDFLEQPPVFPTIPEVPRIGIPVRVTRMHRHDVRHAGTHRRLYSLHRVEHQKSQLSVEYIEAQNVIEGGPREKLVRPVVGLERNHVRRQSVVPDVSHVAFCPLSVRDLQPPSHQLVHHLPMRQRGLRVEVVTPGARAMMGC